MTQHHDSFDRPPPFSLVNSIHLCANCFDMCPHCGLSAAGTSGEERTRAFRPSIRPLDDMRVVQSNIGTGEEDKKEDGRMESVAKEDRKRERRRFNFLIRRSNGAPTEFHSPPCSSSKFRMNVLSFYFVSFIDSSFL